MEKQTKITKSVCLGENKTMYGMTRFYPETIDFEQSVDGLINDLNAIKEKYKDQYVNVVIDRDYSHTDGYYYCFYGERLETDEEFQDRIDQDKKKKQNKIKADREQLEKLKKLYPEEFK